MSQVIAGAALVGMAGAWLAPASAGAVETHAAGTSSASVRTVAAVAPLESARPITQTRGGSRGGDDGDGSGGTEITCTIGGGMLKCPVGKSQSSAGGTSATPASAKTTQASTSEDQESDPVSGFFKLIKQVSGGVSDVAKAAGDVGKAAGSWGDAAKSIAGAVSAAIPLIGPLLALIPH